MLEDLRIARSALEEGHPGIYRFTPKQKLDAIFDHATNSKLELAVQLLKIIVTQTIVSAASAFLPILIDQAI